MNVLSDFEIEVDRKYKETMRNRFPPDGRERCSAKRAGFRNPARFVSRYYKCRENRFIL